MANPSRKLTTSKAAPRRFSQRVLAVLHKDKIIGLRAGSAPHRFIGLWMVVVEGRVFVRSWSLTPGGWYETLRREPHGTMQVGERQLKIRAAHPRSERLKDAIDRAYKEKYNTPGSIRYVRDLCRARSRATTTELVPR